MSQGAALGGAAPLARRVPAARLRRSRREGEGERAGPAAGITENHGRGGEGVRAPVSRAAPRGPSRAGGGSREAALWARPRGTEGARGAEGELSPSVPAKRHLWPSIPPLCRPGFGRKRGSGGRALSACVGAPGFGAGVLSWPGSVAVSRHSPAGA